MEKQESTPLGEEQDAGRIGAIDLVKEPKESCKEHFFLPPLRMLFGSALKEEGECYRSLVRTAFVTCSMLMSCWQSCWAC